MWYSYLNHIKTDNAYLLNESPNNFAYFKILNACEYVYIQKKNEIVSSKKKNINSWLGHIWILESYFPVILYNYFCLFPFV